MGYTPTGGSDPSAGSADSVSVGNTTTEIIAENARRKIAIVTNASDEDMFLNIGADAVMNKGIRLQPNDILEINDSNRITGAINGICSSGTKTALTFEAD